MGNYYVTVAGAGVKDGSNWANAFDLANFQTYAEGTPTLGDKYFIKEGTYTLTSSINLTPNDGDLDNFYEIIGVKSATTNEPPVPSDWAVGTERPLLEGGDYGFNCGGYYRLQNLQHTTTNSLGLSVETGGHIINCKSTNNSGSAGRSAFTIGNDGNIIDCEGICTNGFALTAGSSRPNIFFCYFHDSANGVKTSTYVRALFCIFDTIPGTCLNINERSQILNCTFYNAGCGIYINNNFDYITVMNCAFDSCTCGISIDHVGVPIPNMYFDYNNFASNNTKDMSWDGGSTEDNSAKGPHDTAYDSDFTDAAGGNFSLTAASNLIDAAKGITLGVS